MARGVRTLTVAALAAVAIAAQAGVASAAPAGGAALRGAFGAAAARTGVPSSLLMAMGYVDTHWQMPATVSLDGGWGVMHLVDRPDRRQLALAARITRLSFARLRRDVGANILGGAAVLARLAGASPPRRLSGWYVVVTRMGGQRYADQVFDVLATGATARVGAQTVRLVGDAQAARARSAQATSGDYPLASWVPANRSNYTTSNRPVSYQIKRIVIHVTDGSYASAISWFQDSAAAASAHYVIRSSDGAITQMVRHRDIAWHAGNWPYNTTSIGIEHEAIADDCSWYTAAMYRSSARLVASLVERYAIPIDRQHIIGHSEVPDPFHAGQYGGADHHTDPGRCWNWTTYLQFVRRYASAAPASSPPASASPPASRTVAGRYQQVVDDRTPGRFAASKAWGNGRVTPGHYGSDYRYARPASVADPALFKVKVPAAGNYRVYVRWPASRRYSASAPIAIQTVSRTLWTRVNERKNGGRWISIGTFRLAAGDAWLVRISRATKARGYVVADAVRIQSTP